MVALRISWWRVVGRPFRGLPPPQDRRELLSRRQAGPAILLYRALLPHLDADRALELTREVVLAGTVVFLGATIGPLSRDALVAMTTEARHEYVRCIGERFFNATLRWDEVSAERVRFTVTACLFPGLCRAAGAPAVAPLLCEGDAVYFGDVIGKVELSREHTIAGGAGECPFVLTWLDSESRPGPGPG